MELEHATLAQVRRGRDGRSILVEEDTLQVVARLKEIDPALKVLWNEYGEHFVVVETLPDGSEKLVTTATELNAALIERIRLLGSEDYDYAAELDRLDARAEREKNHAFHETVGEGGEKLYHALRKDLGIKSRIAVPRDPNG